MLALVLLTLLMLLERSVHPRSELLSNLLITSGLRLDLLRGLIEALSLAVITGGVRALDALESTVRVRSVAALFLKLLLILVKFAQLLLRSEIALMISCNSILGLERLRMRSLQMLLLPSGLLLPLSEPGRIGLPAAR